jgi:hypothetical protein
MAQAMGYFLWSGTGAIDDLDCDSEQAALAELQFWGCDTTLWYRGEGFCRARLVAVKTLAPPLLLGERAAADQSLGLPTPNPSPETPRSVMDAFRAAECRAPNPGEVMGQIILEQHPPPLRPLTNWPEGFDLGGDHD